MSTLTPPPSPGIIADAIERMRLDVLHLEHLCSGYYVSGSAAADLKDMAERLVNLSKPNKGHLAEAKAREMKDAA